MNHWERLDLRNGRNEVHDFFAIVATDGDSPFPLAMFAAREDAEAWVVDHPGDYAILVARPFPPLDELRVWNCVDGPPEDE